MRFGAWVDTMVRGRPATPLPPAEQAAEQIRTVIAKHRAWYRHLSRADQDAVIIAHIGWEAYARYGGGERVAAGRPDGRQRGQSDSD